MTNQLAERNGSGPRYELSYMANEADMKALGEIAQKVAPWAGKTRHCPKMTGTEVALVVRRATEMGIDPLNPYETQVSRDKKGVIRVDYHYSLIIQWVSAFKGEHTDPKFYRLTEEQLVEHGLAKTSVAYRVEIYKIENLFKMDKLVESGLFTAERVREMFCITGIGVATKQEFSGEYFAPKTRSPRWKVEKRAVSDAYRKHYGTPTRAEIVEMRRMLGHGDLTPQDWENTAKLAPGDAVALAEAKAKERTDEPMSDEDLRDAQGALFGEAPQYIDYEDVEEEVVELEQEQEPEPEQEPVQVSEPEPELEHASTRDWRAACRGIYKELRNQGLEFSLDKGFSGDQFKRSHEAMEEAIEELSLATPPAEVQTYLVAKIDAIKKELE